MKDSESVNNIQISPDLLQQLAMNQERKQDDEIDFVELWRVIWAGKWFIIAITSLFAVGTILYALSLPNIYKSEALLAPTERESGLSGMASQLGGLASLAGVSLGGGKSDKTGLALEIMKSRAFVFKFIEEHELTEPLMAAKGWNLETDKLVFDADIYDMHTKTWVREVEPPLKAKPSLQESYEEFQKIISINADEKTSMVTVSIEHYSPYVAQQWVNWIIDAVNEEMKIRDLTDANNSVSYLNNQLAKTKVADVQAMLYQLIEEQTKTIMFANVRKQYALKTIDPAIVPELKSGPKRAIITVLGVLLGCMLAIVIVLIRHFIANNKYT